MLRQSGPDAELSRVLELRGAARQEQLIKLSERFPHHAPVWMELAEEHLSARRKEEAMHAARRALGIDRGIYQRFSSSLRAASELLYLKLNTAQGRSAPVSSRPAPKARTRPAPVYGRVGNARQIGEIEVQVARARALEGPERRRKVEDLTRKHPDQGRAWLALAEVHMKDRRVEESMAALQRALVLEPDLERNLSRDLMNARRYHKAGLDVSGGTSKPAYRRAPSHGCSRRQRLAKGTPDPDHRPAVRAQNHHPSGRTRAPSPGPQGHMSGPSVGKHLALALEVQDKHQRLTALRGLKKMAPDNPAVLFHFAIEAAMAGEFDEARIAGKALQRLSPERYRKLYRLAESYWPTDDAPHGEAMGRAPSAPRGRARAASQPSDFDWSPSSERTSFFTPHNATLPPPQPQPQPQLPKYAARAIQISPPAEPGPRPAVPAPQMRPRPQPLKPRPLSAPPLGTPPRIAKRPQPTPPRVAMEPKPPPPRVAAKPPAPQPVPVMISPHTGLNPIRRKSSGWHTTGALIAGVAAGLLFAVLLVFLLSRLEAIKSSSLPQPPGDVAAALATVEAVGAAGSASPAAPAEQKLQPV